MSWQCKVVGYGELLCARWKPGVGQTMTSTTSQPMAKGTVHRAREPYFTFGKATGTCKHARRNKNKTLTSDKAVHKVGFLICSSAVHMRFLILCFPTRPVAGPFCCFSSTLAPLPWKTGAV